MLVLVCLFVRSVVAIVVVAVVVVVVVAAVVVAVAVILFLAPVFPYVFLSLQLLHCN